MKVKFKELIVSMLIPFAAGFVSRLASGDIPQSFQSLARPPLSPPAAVFPVVWTILYALMGVSLYLVITSKASAEQKKSAVTVFLIQLAVNLMWTPIFFGWGKYLLAFIWLVFLWIWAAVMISEFGKVSKTAAKLQIPYIIWLTFALYLNLGIVLLNR